MRASERPTAARTRGPAGPYDVAIVGGGITGCAAAYHLAAAGARVVVLERSDVGTEASGRNAGSLHGQIQSASFDQRGTKWAKEFLPALTFLLGALDLWRGLGAELGQDLEVTTNGGLLLVDSTSQLRQVEAKVAIEREAGLDSRVLSRPELLELAPYVATSMIGAGFSPVEGKANPMLAAPAFARKAVQMGAEVMAGTRVLRIEASTVGARLLTTAGEFVAEQVVLASGNELAGHAAALGTKLPVTTEPVQVAATEPVEPLVSHLVYYAGAPLTLKQARAGSLLIGGGWPALLDPVSGYPTVDISSLRANLAVALKVAPVVGSALVIRSWAGIGNGTPDERPLIGRLPAADRVLVGLFPYMGLTAGPLLGRVLADLAIGRDPGLDLAPFRLDRFSAS
jgi:sarcosine oxidase, subunit beta